MHLFEADEPLIQDMKEESEVLEERSTETFTVTTARHPTLGKLVLIAGADGDGFVVETEA